jgi:hypothetical protein
MSAEETRTMGVLSEVRKLGFFEILNYLLLVAASACPGCLVVLRFLPHSFSNLDFLKLVFLAVSLTLPLLLANLFFIAIVFYDRESDDPMKVLAVASLACAASLYVGLLASFLLGLGFRVFMAAVAVANVVVIALLTLSGNLEFPKKGKQAGGVVAGDGDPKTSA